MIQMSDRKFQIKYICAGALCGLLWHLMLWLLYKVVGGSNPSITPYSNVFSVVGSVVAGMVTGIVIALIFRRLFLVRSKLAFACLPLATLPTAIVIYSILIWFVALLFEERTDSSALMALVGITTTYLIYGLMTIFTPLLYGIALLSQFAFRTLLKRATQ